MGQSLFKSYFHIVFSTKLRGPFLESRRIRNALFKYLSGICSQHECRTVAINGFHEHVHIFLQCGKYVQIPKLVGILKQRSSKWLKEQGLKDFSWQNGYAAFSVSPTHVEGVQKCIKNQEEHHQKIDFCDELIRILRINKMEYDDAYLWD